MVPYLFRIVNAEGTQDDVLNGGFESSVFWIRNPSASLSSSLPGPTAHIGSQSSSSAPTTSHGTPTTISSPDRGTDISKKDSGSSSVAVGAGVGVGVGVAVIAAGLGIFWFIRRRNKSSQQQQQWPSPGGPVNSPPQGGLSPQWSYNTQPYYAPGAMTESDRSYTHSPPPMKPYQPSELGATIQSPVEVPHNHDPRELPANEPWRSQSPQW